MPLTAAVVRAAAPRARPYKLADGGKLYLLVTPTGRPKWRMKYRFGGKERLLAFGTFPDVSLAEARDRRDDARQLLRQNVDPAAARRQTREEAAAAAVAGTSFEELARAWHARRAPDWSAEHARDVLQSLERDVFPSIGALPLAAIDTPRICELLLEVENRGAIETARRIQKRISAVFDNAISRGLASANPALVVAGALKKGGGAKRRQPAAVELELARQALRAVDGAAGRSLVGLASRLLALTVVRPAVVRDAAWSEFEGIDWSTGAADSPAWRIPPARMKLVRARKGDQAFEHIVPLSGQAVELLLEIRRAASAGEILFPNRCDRRRPMSKNALGDLYGRAGLRGRHVPHGWRAAFSTIMNERHRSDRGVIDLALAHTPKDKVEAAYNRAEHLERRAELLQEWADLLLSSPSS